MTEDNHETRIKTRLDNIDSLRKLGSTGTLANPEMMVAERVARGALEREEIEANAHQRMLVANDLELSIEAHKRRTELAEHSEERDIERLDLFRKQVLQTKRHAELAEHSEERDVERLDLFRTSCEQQVLQTEALELIADLIKDELKEAEEAFERRTAEPEQKDVYQSPVQLGRLLPGCIKPDDPKDKS